MRGRLIRRPRISFLLILSVFSQRTEKPKQTAESPLLFVGFPPSFWFLYSPFITVAEERTDYAA